MPEITQASIEERRKNRALGGTEADYINRPGYWRKPKANGGYEWGCRFRPNEGGTLTREAHEVWEREAPAIRAETARNSEIQASIPREVLRDQAGRLQYVSALDPALAGATALHNGWSHHWRAGGNRVERGIDGMLWRYSQGWEPLGVRCLGTPLRGKAHIAVKGIQHDPDGRPWRGVNGRWEPIL